LFFCDIESEILYPPTDTSRFAAVLIDEYTPPFPRKQYFLSFARLSPPKRVDIIVDTFLLTPEQNLILTYGKNDPLKQMILDKIAGAKNIIALESPDDTKLISLIQ
jgi:glycosyltransferase involved in cell wall biosynthesis